MATNVFAKVWDLINYMYVFQSEAQHCQPSSQNCSKKRFKGHLE